MAQSVQDNVTIGDVLRLALPLSATLISGADQRQRSINWVVALTSWRNAAEELQSGDLALLPATMLNNSQEEIVLMGVESLVEIEAVGIIAPSGLPASALEAAQEAKLPIVVVPPEYGMRDLHRNISSLLIDRQRQTIERGLQLYRRLSELSREGHGLEKMTETMSQLTGKLVLVQDKRLDIRAMSQPADSPISEDAILKILKQKEQLPATLRNRKNAAQAMRNHWQQTLPLFDGDRQAARLVSPIISGDRARGYVSVVGWADELDPLDALTVEHGAAACGLEMARAKAVNEAKKEMRGDFLEGLLANRLPAEEIQRLESRLDHNTRLPHVVVTLRWAEWGEDPPSLRRLETVVNWLSTTHKRPALVHLYGEMCVCIFQTLYEGDRGDFSSALDLTRRIREYTAAEYNGSQLVAGISGLADTLEDWPQHYRQANKAMELAARLNMNETVDYSSLGIYQLLMKLEDVPAVQKFSQEVVGPLADYDRQHNSSFTQTMQSFFEHHGNVSQTAEALFIHRNTLLYRLDRIKELTGQDIDNADMRLAMHLALKLYQLQSSK